MVISDKGKGANWARNKGFKQVDTEYVLFSDNDIKWRQGVIPELLEALEENPDASYSYGSYMMNGDLYCNISYDYDKLKKFNYISTMSLIRAKDFPGFDEKIERFQDWDLWLTMAKKGQFGVHCGEILFDTEVKDGITHNGKLDSSEAQSIIKSKHCLWNC